MEGGDESDAQQHRESMVSKEERAQQQGQNKKRDNHRTSESNIQVDRLKSESEMITRLSVVTHVQAECMPRQLKSQTT
jgi:hypothetical protein